ncbi:DEAD/DEAH box helicase family protein [Maledivibacter halophilus]|uniref:DNA or RNA helicases of superfamily II n=1 Tax=Maledivibacter halophilus TaxID=36842 RepID=A0A1T5IF24_9FIRM|nr:DEAD/DEAH box helicase family protein [Maledivibacter halophilus]SKC37715.1 DNA or RNA helicases of superfamily II [Maledivibacter halophilus]
MNKVLLQTYVEEKLKNRINVNELGLDFEDFNKNEGFFLYDYQINALKNAVTFLKAYFDSDASDIYDFYRKHISREDKNILSIKSGNTSFELLREYFKVDEDKIKFYNFTNRACFWMATGSGKTPIIVKLIEFLYELMKKSLIPTKKVLIVAPDDKLISQIKEHVEIFNRSTSRASRIYLKNLKEYEKNAFSGLNPLTPDSLTVYYTRATLISEENKENLFDFKDYIEKEGWYLILDEAHKGDQESSKRKHYLNILAKNGFLFNFSATFTDLIDQVTTVFNFNLSEFIKAGYGKNIKVLDEEFRNFKARNKMEEKDNLTDDEKKKIILKSLIVFAGIKKQYEKLGIFSKKNKVELMYHNPLMITISNEINTKNADMKLYFEYLSEIAKKPVSSEILNSIKGDIIKNLDNNYDYIIGDEVLSWNFKNIIAGITYEEILKYVFNSRSSGDIEVNEIGNNNDELSFRLKTSLDSKPFALIKASNVKLWKKNILKNYLFNDDVVIEKSRFSSIHENENGINILMGSRQFIEGWNSNRPNIINFINMGTDELNTKLILQAIGRGVRIEPFKNNRRRIHKTKKFVDFNYEVREKLLETTNILETLFIFSTNKQVIKNIIEGINKEKNNWKNIKGIRKSSIRKTLYVPVYKELQYNPKTFKISNKDYDRVSNYINRTSKKLLLVRDNFKLGTVDNIQRKVRIEGYDGKSLDKTEKQLINIIENHYNQKGRALKGFRKEEKIDIQHYSKLRYNLNTNSELSKQELIDLEKGIKKVLSGLDNKYSKEQLGIVQALKALGKEEALKNEAMLLVAEDKNINVDEIFHEVSLQDLETKYNVKLKNISSHYYNPIILSDDNNKYQHIIKDKSEIIFLDKLEEYLAQNRIENYEWWYFSRIDESTDNIYIPYYDTDRQCYRKFFPDFIFWLKKENKYYIKFIDPKGLSRETNPKDKIVGFREIFDLTKMKIVNDHVKVELLYFNDEHYEDPLLNKYTFYEIERLFKD